MQVINKAGIGRKNSLVLVHIRKHSIEFWLIILIGFISSCISFLLTISIGEFFSLQFQTGSSKSRLFLMLGLHLNTMQEFLFLYVILIVAKGLMTYLENIGSYRLGESWVKDLREKIFTAQLDWPASGTLKRSYGKYLLRYSNDMKSVQQYLTKGILDAIKNVLFLLTGLFILYKIHPLTTGLLIMLLSIIGVIVYFLFRYQKPFIQSSRTSRSSLLAYVAKSFSGVEKIKHLNKELATAEQFQRRSETLFHANMRVNKFSSIIQSSSVFLIFAAIGILLWQMTFQYLRINASDGFLIVLIILLLQGALRRILKVTGYLNKGKISLNKIEKLLQEPVSEVGSMQEVS